MAYQPYFKKMGHWGPVDGPVGQSRFKEAVAVSTESAESPTKNEWTEPLDLPSSTNASSRSLECAMTLEL